MKQFLVMTGILLSSLFAFSQRKTYDITTYIQPAGWQEEKGNGFISYSRVAGSSWAQLVIFEKTASTGNIQTDFDNAWKLLVATPRQLTTAPDKAAPDSAEGWTVLSGSGSWAYNGTPVASVLTVFSNRQVCVGVLCNTAAKPYLKDYQDLVASLQLVATDKLPAVGTTSHTNTSGSTAADIAGSWEFTMNETSGSLITGGYFRREYRLYPNGTYEFLTKTFSAYNPVISFGRETGTWTVKDNKLTIRPNQGKNEEWSKSASGRNMEWGKLMKTTGRKLETVTYAMELNYLSGMQKAYLRLSSQGPTVRDGRSGNDDKAIHLFTYSPGTPGKPLVDLPPGKK